MSEPKRFDSNGEEIGDDICGKWYVFDLDMGTETSCDLPKGHAGPHTDGMIWFDDLNNRVPPPPPPE